MDHLPYPKNPAFNHPLVPYVCTESYDGLDFVNYPIRAGWPQVLSSAQYPDFDKYERAHPSDDRKLEKFFQNWIFFGLLHELLGPQKMYNKDDYIRIESGVKYVHTKLLMQRLNQWKDVVTNWHPPEKISVYGNLVKCLRLAQDSLMVLSQSEKQGILVEDNRHPSFNRAIKISLAAICEAIVNAVDEALISAERTNMPDGWMRIWWDLATEQELRRIGWCPSQIALLNKNMATFSAQYFLRAVHMNEFDRDSSHVSELGGGHNHCDANACDHLQVKQGTYRTAHCCQSLDCGLLGPNRKEILERLRVDTIPLLRIQGTCIDDINVTVVPYEPGVRYVALSHVWVDGLGNETSNQLPRCQLLRLHSLIEKLRAQIPWGGETVEDGELYLWIDTICCPVVDPQNTTTLQEQKRYKRLALGQMRSVYREAAFVLVLDRTLEPYAYKDIGVLEAALRLIASNWMRRLWTLQEAVLAKNLVIQFKDRAVDLRTIWQDAVSLRLSDLSHRAISFEIIFFCGGIRRFLQLGEDNQGGADLFQVTRAIRLRRVSKQVDEPLCIASLMDFDVRNMTSMDEDAEGRMCALWKAMAGASPLIYKDIVFNTLRRLRTEGFRWAPASLQQSSFGHGQLPTAETDESSRQQATLTSRGLQVKLPGFKIRIEYPHPRLPSTLWPGNELVRDSIHLRHPDGRWFVVSRTYPHEYPERARADKPRPGRDLADPAKTLWDVLSDRRKTYYLILEDPRYSSHFQNFGSQMGLIVCPGRSEGGSVVRSLMTVAARSAKPNQTILFKRAYELANMVRQADIQPPNLEQKAYDVVMKAVNDALKDEAFATKVRNMTNANPESAAGIAGVSSAAEVLTSAGMSSLANLFSSVALSSPQALWNAQGLLGGFVAARVMGRYAVVQESFEPDTVWCVD